MNEATPRQFPRSIMYYGVEIPIPLPISVDPLPQPILTNFTGLTHSTHSTHRISNRRARRNLLSDFEDTITSHDMEYFAPKTPEKKDIISSRLDQKNR